MDEPAMEAHQSLQARRHWLRYAVLGVLGLILLVIVLQNLGGGDRFSSIDEASGAWAYLAVFFFVFGDALCALFPGETTLNSASTLAAQGALNLWLVMLAGAVGAVAGDSALYWIARRNRKRFQPRMDAAMSNAKIAAAMAFIGTSASTLLVFGRYVPGLRLVVNATLGLAAHPYRHFLLWSAIGGTTWSVYTCGLAYLIGTALAGFPLASVIISGVITTLAIAVVFLVARKRGRANETPAPG